MYGKLKESRIQKEQEIFAKGYNLAINESIPRLNEAITIGRDQGISEVLVQILQKTDDCQMTDIFYNNFTRTIVDVNCIKNSE